MLHPIQQLMHIIINVMHNKFLMNNYTKKDPLLVFQCKPIGSAHVLGSILMTKRSIILQTIVFSGKRMLLLLHQFIRLVSRSFLKGQYT